MIDQCNAFLWSYVRKSLATNTKKIIDNLFAMSRSGKPLEVFILSQISMIFYAGGPLLLWFGISYCMYNAIIENILFKEKYSWQWYQGIQNSCREFNGLWMDFFSMSSTNNAQNLWTKIRFFPLQRQRFRGASNENNKNNKK